MTAEVDAAAGRRPKLLFVCSRNEWRSPTAEDLYRDDPRVEVRSAGTASGARQRISAGLFAWADTIFAMEQRHASVLADRFGRDETRRRVTVLDIPDRYRRGDPELAAWLRDEVEAYLRRIS